MNFVLHGHAVSSGITIGYAHRVTTARLEVAHYEVAEDAIEAELARFDAGLRKAREQLQALKAHIPADSPPEFEAFLNLHRMILDDSALAQAPKELIRLSVGIESADDLLEDLEQALVSSAAVAK